MAPHPGAFAGVLSVAILCATLSGSVSCAIPASFFDVSLPASFSSDAQTQVSGLAPSLQPIAPPIHVGVESISIAVDSAANKTYVANFYSRTVSVISYASSVVLSDTLAISQNPNGLLVDAHDNLLFVTSYNYTSTGNPMNSTGWITAFSTTNDSQVGSVHVGGQPWAVVVTPHPDELFVSSYYGGGVIILSVHPLRLLTSLNLTAYGMVYDPNNGLVFAATGELNGSVVAIDPATNTVVNTIRVGGIPDFVLLNPWNGLLYVACSGPSDGIQNATYVINATAELPVAIVPLSGQPRMAVLDSLNGDVIVGTNRFTNQRQFYDGNLTVISGTNDVALANLPISAYFYGLASDNVTGALYLLTYGNLTVLNATTVSPLYAVGVNSSAYLLAVDQARGILFIVDPSYDIYSSGEVDVYQPPLPMLISVTSASSFTSVLVLGTSLAAGVVVALVYATGRRRRS